MAKRALGLYDSGVGGFTILDEIKKVLPDMTFEYFEDRAILPIGKKSVQEIQKSVIAGVDSLFSRGCPLVILACNTASVTTVRKIQEKLRKSKYYKTNNVLGISIPLIEKMRDDFAKFKNKKGLILSTPATHKTGFYQEEFRRLGFKNIISLPDVDLVLAIESKDSKKIDEAIRKTLKPIRGDLKNIKFVILACTHFPHIKSQLKTFFNPETKIIFQGEEVAQKLKTYLKIHPEYNV